MDYIHKFTKRIEQFMYAVDTYEYVMEYEFRTAVEELDSKPNEIIVNLAGGGLNIRNYLPHHTTYLPLDFSKEWCTYDLQLIYTSYDKLPLENESVDKIIILAVLHHFTDEERDKLYKECHRILKKSGKMVIADVIKNSNQDIWLNSIVNKYNPFGHQGRFFDSEDAKLIESNHFDVQMKYKKYNWQFTNPVEMIDYLKHLFYLMISDDELLTHVNAILKPHSIGNKYCFEWKLLYFICEPC